MRYMVMNLFNDCIIVTADEAYAKRVARHNNGYVVFCK